MSRPLIILHSLTRKNGIQHTRPLKILFGVQASLSSHLFPSRVGLDLGRLCGSGSVLSLSLLFLFHNDPN